MCILSLPFYLALLDAGQRRYKLIVALLAFAFIAYTSYQNRRQEEASMRKAEKAFQRKHNLPDNWLKEN